MSESRRGWDEKDVREYFGDEYVDGPAQSSEEPETEKGSLGDKVINRLKYQGLNGNPEDIVYRPKGCKGDCLLERLLPEERRKVKVVGKDVPKNHPHRDIIEQVCGEHYDDKCHIKYLFMRSGIEDYMAAQMGAVKYYAEKEGLEFEEALEVWGRDVYAKRWEEIWNLTKREVVRDGRIVDVQQTMTVRGLSEKVTAETKFYNKIVRHEKKFRRKYIKDNKIGDYLKNK